MRLPPWLLALLLVAPCPAWDTLPHQRITRAALETLPKAQLRRLGSEAAPLIEIYCIFPDRYEEMQRYGFVRNSPGPRTAAEIQPYCVRPDGQPIHGATGDRETDAKSLVYLFERIRTNLSANRPGEVARYAGVLAHFIEDSLSPPHAVDADRLAEMTPVPAQMARVNIHAVIERSIPEFTMVERAPRVLAGRQAQVADTVLAQCESGAAQNRRDLSAMVNAAALHDERTLDPYRLRAGRKAAEILADALFTLFQAGSVVR